MIRTRLKRHLRPLHTLFENVRLQGKTLKDEYRVAHKYLNELIQKAGELGLHDEDLGITPDMREKLNFYDNIAKVNRARIEAVNKVRQIYRDNFFTGVDISNKAYTEYYAKYRA